MIKQKDKSRYKRIYNQWKGKVDKSYFEDETKGKSNEGASSFKLLYNPEDCENINYINDIGFPGQFPYTRGIQPSMYRGRLWTMRQYAGFGTAEKTNERFKYLIKQGQTGLSVAFDLPTQLGLDSDNPLSKGEVGKVGVAISSLDDMELLFNGIPLDRISTSMTINATAAIILSMYLILAKQNNISYDKLSGTIQNDILKEYIARGTYIFPIEPSIKLSIDIIEFCNRHCPNWNPISISGYHIREAGSTAIQELAFTFSNAIAYIEKAIQRGLDIDSFAPRLSFFFNCHINFFEEIAKFRAARKIWAKLMKIKFKAKNPRSWQLRFHTQTAGCTLTAQQPYNNIIRVSLQALAAVLGGTQSLHTNSFDEALSLPTEDAATIALRTQQIIAYESGITNTIDPLAGSFFIEKLTAEIEEKVSEEIEKIQRMGGAIKAIEIEYIQKEIEKSAYQWQKNIEENKNIIVGVNRFISQEKQNIPLLLIDPSIEEEQIKRLKKYRETRNSIKLYSALSNLKEKAKDKSNNLMYPIIEAIEAKATLGEIVDTLKDVFGEYKLV